MAITRKPQATTSQSPPVDVEALINRGGSSPRSAPPDTKPEIVPIQLRLPADMLNQIDSAVKARPVRLPRHTWILEAIHEKLSREMQPPEPKS